MIGFRFYKFFLSQRGFSLAKAQNRKGVFLTDLRLCVKPHGFDFKFYCFPLAKSQRRKGIFLAALILTNCFIFIFDFDFDFISTIGYKYRFNFLKFTIFAKNSGHLLLWQKLINLSASSSLKTKVNSNIPLANFLDLLTPFDLQQKL